jgi:large-conductance mechanosensitive channel
VRYGYVIQTFLEFVVIAVVFFGVVQLTKMMRVATPPAAASS